MYFEDLWVIIVERNVQLQEKESDETLTMTIKGFKKALKLAYEKGIEQGNCTNNMFKTLFGG